MVTILPAIRGILASNGQLPRLRIGPATAAAGKLRLSATDAPDTLVAALRANVPAGARQVCVESLGTITAEFHTGCGRTSGKIALVTGAAQGFGCEIAAELAAQGAWVALADVNVAGAMAAAQRINDACGRDAAMGVAMNVTDPASIQTAVSAVVTAFGGLDVLVANAGVLRAGSVKTLSVSDLDFVTNVNYKGYFLCAQAVAPILALQHLACPVAWFDIIQINSKSGLQGSNRNGAYAGSKFGGVGLTQSFAMELVEDGIKVNSICPGNFFDGPLWSDPQNGLFAQYLRTGKVPGAKTVADVKRFYEAKVPMGRGCTTPDVMRAIYYLMEQRYETGQALPVTGGQVMLA
ncbi:MAG: SDR family NAD(P)-dependent oxidoreductase [Kiritimatiellia bacterium]